ncbi:MAG: hypothetical protein O2818_00105 [Bacteroidetes bacterium]|nr:hypothetical protein [Bacteroidota bacterium]MDA1335263.1 hypothetical protein [Bacteroidota bacterium]
MQIKHWEEGKSWACLPQSVALFVCMTFLLVQANYVFAGLAFFLGLAFMLCESGCSWNSEKRLFRSYKALRFWGKLIRWGSWVHVSSTAAVRLHRTKETMMNRRGAPQGIRIDSWELQHQDEQGNWHPLHDFVDRELAKSACELIGESIGLK